MPKLAFMDQALKEAKWAAERCEVPVGAAIVYKNQIIASNGNRVLELKDPLAHAEILVLRHACHLLDNERLQECDLYVTLEPCTMCAGAISLARVRRLYFGADDIKGGAIEHGVRFFNQSACHHAPEVYSGIHATRSTQLLQKFFQQNRLSALRR